MALDCRLIGEAWECQVWADSLEESIGPQPALRHLLGCHRTQSVPPDDDGPGDGPDDGYGDGYGYGYGDGYGSGYGSGYGDGYGDGDGNGYGN